MDGDHDVNASLNPPPEISVPHSYFITFPPKFQRRLAQVLDGDDNDNFHNILHIFDSINQLCTKLPCSLNQFLPVRICDDQSWIRSEISWENPQDESPHSNMSSQSNILPRQALKELLTSVATSGRAESLGMPWRILTNMASSIHRTPVLNALENGESKGMCALSEGSKMDLQKTCKANVKLPVIPLPESWSKGSKICQGSTGEVWQVTISKGVFAMKTFALRELWRAEADIVDVLSHPHIVHTFGSTEPKEPGAGRDEFSLVMERMADDLSGWMLSRGQLKPLDSLNILLQVAQAMEYLHGQRVVHGDLKCGNILISQFDISRGAEQFIVVKVADFGNAKKATSEPFIPTRGTTRWSSPEVLRYHESKIDKVEHPFKTDVYSFGLIAYEVLTGCGIFEGLISTLKEKLTGSDESLSPYFKKFDAVNKKYSKSFIPFMKRCSACEPTERPTFHEIIEKIKETKSSMIARSKTSSHTVKRLIEVAASKRKRATTKFLTNNGRIHPTTQPISSVVESKVLEDENEITKNSEEVKTDLAIIKSPEPSVCYAPVLENPSSRPMIKNSKRKLGTCLVNATKKKLKTTKEVVKKTKEVVKKKYKKCTNFFKPDRLESGAIQTLLQDPPPPTQSIPSLGAPVESRAQAGHTTKRTFEDDAGDDGSKQSHKKRKA